jgi:hypothetical protein
MSEDPEARLYDCWQRRSVGSMNTLGRSQQPKPTG